MIVTCNKDKLNGLVQTTLRAVSSRITMPILSGLLVNAGGGKLVMSSTDLEMSIRAEVEAGVQEEGSTVISGRLLGDVVKTLPAGEVNLSTGDKYMTVKTTGGQYRIREMMPEDFPQIPVWEGTSSLKVNGGDFLLAIQQTSRASSSDEKRPVLTGTLVEKNLSDGFLRMVATDSYRLSSKDVEVSGTLGDWTDCIIPTKTLNEVARLTGSIDADVEVKMQDRQVMFRIGETVVSTRLIEGQFPNYKQLLPKSEKTTVKVEKQEFLSCLKRALIFGHNVRIGVYKDHIRVVTETPEVGDSQEEIGAEVEGEEMEIGFSANYILDGVSAVDTEKVRIKLDEPQKPAMVGAEDNDKFIYIVMPVRLTR